MSPNRERLIFAIYGTAIAPSQHYYVRFWKSKKLNASFITLPMLFPQYMYSTDSSSIKLVNHMGEPEMARGGRKKSFNIIRKRSTAERYIL